MTITTARRRLALNTMLVAGAIIWAAPAASEPGQPTPEPTPLPAPAEFVPAPAGIGNPLAQIGGQPAGPFGLPDLSANAGSMLLGQNAAPAAPGAPAPTAVPNLSAFNPDYLLPQNLTPAAPGAGTAAPGIAPDGDNSGTGRIAFLRRLYEMYQGGSLTGALLGQEPDAVPGEQPGEPTAGKTPPPATG